MTDNTRDIGSEETPLAMTDQNDTDGHRGTSPANLESKIGRLRERLSDALAGGVQHWSDCAVYNAPAYEPEPCNCGALDAAADRAYNLVNKIREHNGWTHLRSDSEARKLAMAFLADRDVPREPSK